MELNTFEKRKHERYVLDAPIHIKWYKDNYPSVITATSRDISSTGVFVNTAGIQLPSMQNVHLELTLTINKLKELFDCSNNVTLKIQGSVIRTHSDGIVIQFDKNYSIIPVVHEKKRDSSYLNAEIPVGRVKK